MTTTRHQISNHDIKSLIRAGSSGLVIYGNCSGLHLTVQLGGPWFIHKKWLLFNQNNKLSLTGPVLGVLGITKGISVHPGSSREEAHYCRSCKLKQTHPDCDKDQRFLLSSQPEAPPTSIKQLRRERRTQSTLILNDTPLLWWVYENIITTQWVRQTWGHIMLTLALCASRNVLDSEQSFKLADGEDGGQNKKDVISISQWHRNGKITWPCWESMVTPSKL